MKKSIFFLPLFILGCTAQGPTYTGTEKGNIIVYRANSLAGAASTYHVQIGDSHCALKNGGFYVTTIKKRGVLTAAWVQGAVSSSIDVTSGDYVRVEHNVGNSLIQGAGNSLGAVGAALGAQTSGDFIFNKIPPEVAKSELRQLNRDCI